MGASRGATTEVCRALPSLFAGLALLVAIQLVTHVHRVLLRVTVFGVDIVVRGGLVSSVACGGLAAVAFLVVGFSVVVMLFLVVAFRVESLDLLALVATVDFTLGLDAFLGVVEGFRGVRISRVVILPDLPVRVVSFCRVGGLIDAVVDLGLFPDEFLDQFIGASPSLVTLLLGGILGLPGGRRFFIDRVVEGVA